MKNPKSPLKRQPGLIPLSREHHRVLLLAQLLKKNVPDYRGMPTTIEGKLQYLHDTFHVELKPHIEKEEAILLPLVREHAPGLSHMCDMLTDEHQQIQEHILAVLSLEPPYEEADVREQLNKIGLLLEQHVRMEERMFFQRIQQTVDKEILDTLGLDQPLPPEAA